MAVAFDAKPTAYNSADGLNQQAAGVTSISATTGFTVGASATFLSAQLALQPPNGTSAPTGITATWNGVSMAAGPTINSPAGPGGSVAVAMFGLVSPASGAKTLSASWTNSMDVYMSAASFAGTDTVTGVKVADNATATNVTAITVTSDTAGATVAVFCVDGATPTVDQTKIWAEAPLAPGGGGSYAIGGTSNTHNFTGAGGFVQALAGVHVIAAAAARQQQLTLIGAGV